jgi:hypothetical protein
VKQAGNGAEHDAVSERPARPEHQH